MNFSLKTILLAVGIAGSSLVYLAHGENSSFNGTIPPLDSLSSTGADTTQATESTSTIPPPTDNTLKPVFKDSYGDPINNPEPNSPFVIKPSNSKTEIELAPDLSGYEVTQKQGDLVTSPPTKMTPSELAEYRKKELMKQYWKKASKTQEETVRENETFSWAIPKPGTTEPLIEIKPAGNLTVSLGGRWQKNENPQIPVNSQRTGGFDFNQQIQINLQGDIGERLKVNFNWNTNAALDLDNNLQIAFDGKEEDWLRDIQAGNISVPLNTQLITGAQKLFGVKTVMQFGKVGVTSWVSSQQGKRQTQVIRGGGQARDFEFQASEYDAYRHFFLSHYFRDVFEQAYITNPTNPTNGFQITRVEAFITNSNTRTENLKNIVGFLGLGEVKDQNVRNPNIVNPLIDTVSSNVRNPFNNINNIAQLAFGAGDQFRNPENSSTLLGANGFETDQDYVKINSARTLEEGRDFTFHPDLGFISLNSRLQDDEALCVSFEYTLNGQTFKVGEMREDYASADPNDVIFLKMLKPAQVDFGLPTWDLMMKNIYQLNSNNIEPENFQLRVIYRDDASGFDNPSLQEGVKAQNVPILQLLGMDKLDPNGDLIPDGNFDFIPEATILTQRGYLLFPTPEPFGNYMTREIVGGQTNAFFNNNEQNLKNRYAFTVLYENTQAEARRSTEFNKFFVKGQFQSASTANIKLNGFNIAEGSVTIQSGAVTLNEGADFTVNYQIGSVNILNTGVLASGNDLSISFEQADLFRFRTKSLLGTRIEYNHNKDFNFGTTLMRLAEAPNVTRINVGDELINNTQVGADFRFQKNSRLLTKLVDKLPVIQTKATSTVSANWEAAMLLPGNSRVIGEEGSSIIDDFEGAETPFDFSRSITQWVASSTPMRLGNDFNTYSDFLVDGVGTGDHRAKLAWFNPDQSFYLSNALNAQGGLGTSDFHNSNEYTRGLGITEVFPGTQIDGINNNFLSTFDLNYYPAERGFYNYNADPNDIDPSTGRFIRPEENWAGITRQIAFDTDFENSNIEFIEFWIMDPFITQDDAIYEAFPNELIQNGVRVPTSEMGGQLFFNLGSVSEDLVRDRQHGFENGLPTNVDSTEFGLVTNETYLTNAFDNTADRADQDVGFDGIRDEQERSSEFFQQYIDQLSSFVNPNAEEYQKFIADPSSDNFQYFISPDDESAPDNQQRSIIERYKFFNGYEGNSPQQGVESSTNLPDNEDLNDNKTLDEANAYFQYELPINTSVFNGTTEHPYISSISPRVNPKYYQIRIPIKDIEATVGPIRSFNTIKYFRMYMTGFKHPIALRMINLQLVASQWRKYVGIDLDNPELSPSQEPEFNKTFISTVNIEENPEYRIAPGIVRDRNLSSVANVQQNEQSLRLCTEELGGKKGAAAFKNITVDLINYKRIKMFIHGERLPDDRSTNSNEMNAFIRLGTDLTQNYYEIQIPLEFSPEISNPTSQDVWLASNELDLAIDELTKTKIERNSKGLRRTDSYSRMVGKYKITVKGSPDRSTIRTSMLGLVNNTEDDKSACVWFNELRVTDFDKSIGWATVGNVQATLADLGSVSGALRYTSANYGDIESKLADRTRDRSLSYGAQTNLYLHKFGPDKIGVQLPLFASIDGERITPKFNPFDPDVLLKESIQSSPDSVASEVERAVSFTKTIKSINLTNVKKVKVKKDSKNHFFDVENLSLTVGYKEETRQGAQPNSSLGNAIDSYLDQTYNGILNYSYNFQTKPIAPFKKIKSKNLKLISDFNFTPVPSSISAQGNLNRRYFRSQLLNNSFNTDGVTPNYEKRFTFDRLYTLRWNLTQNLNLNYSANANALIDEPQGDRFGEDGGLSRDQYQSEVWDNVRDGGRLKNFNQSATATYQIPINLIPLFDWVSADARYKVDNTWRASAFQTDPLNPGTPTELLDADSVKFGNFYGNAVNYSINTKLNMIKLYNKSKFLKAVSGRKSRKITPKDPEADTIKTKLSDMDGFRGIFNTLMMVKNITLRYDQNHTTDLPGVLARPTFLGIDNSSEFGGGPGTSFLLGSQDLTYLKQQLTQNGWYSRSRFLFTPIQQTSSQNISGKASLEPFQDFRVNLDASYDLTEGYQEVLQLDEFGVYQTLTPTYGGSLKMSYITAPTAFARDNRNNENRFFDLFQKNRNTISQELNNRDTGPGQFNRNGSSSLIPAFIAAYSGREVEPGSNVNRLTPRIPLPNWRVNYGGLSRMKSVRKHFSAVNLSHAYSSTVDVRSFRSSQEYDATDNLNYTTTLNQRPAALDTNLSGDYVPLIIVNEVQISERFSPLIGINVRTRPKGNLKSVTFNMDYNKSRTLTLDMTSAQITEINNNDFIFGFGMTKKDVKIPFKIQGETKRLKNDLTLKTDLSVRDQKTVQRELDTQERDGNQTITAGNLSFQLRGNLDYQYNSKLNVALYFERTINAPKTSSTFRRTTTAFGVRARFSLN